MDRIMEGSEGELMRAGGNMWLSGWRWPSINEDGWLYGYLPDSSIMPAVLVSFTLFVIAKMNVKECPDITCVTFPLGSFLRLKFSTQSVVDHYYNKLKSDAVFAVVHFSKFSIVVRDPHIAVKILKRAIEDENFQSVGKTPKRALTDVAVTEEMDEQYCSTTECFKRKESAMSRIRGAVEKEFRKYEEEGGVFEVVNKSCKELMILFEAKANRKSSIQTKDAALKFVHNIIGICVFGRTVTSLTHSKSEFFPMCERLVKMILSRSEQTNGAFAAKNKEEYQTRKYFTRMIEETSNMVESSSIAKIVFQAALDDPETKILTLDQKLEYATDIVMEICGCVVRYVPGLVSLAVLELASCSDAQNKLRSDVKDVLYSGTPSLSADKLQRYRYLQCVTKEILRKYPVSPLISISNVAKSYVLPDTKLEVNPGVTLMVPSLSIQRDSSVYPNGNHFQPERWMSDETENEDLGELALQFVCNYRHSEFSKAVCSFVLQCAQSGIACLVRRYEFTCSDSSTCAEYANSFDLVRFEKAKIPPVIVSNPPKRH